ncbi:MAG TPA: hypothetical protein VMV93_11045 [Chloroflexota bacterium]|nr:hypothetical protein [Chloroflexota bacterium]
MAVYDTLLTIRQKLETNQAGTESLTFIDARLREAEPEIGNNIYVSENMILRHLVRRTDVRGTDIEIDLLNLMPDETPREVRSELEEGVREAPKPHSFYQDAKRKKRADS